MLAGHCERRGDHSGIVHRPARRGGSGRVEAEFECGGEEREDVSIEVGAGGEALRERSRRSGRVMPGSRCLGEIHTIGIVGQDAD